MTRFAKRRGWTDRRIRSFSIREYSILPLLAELWLNPLQIDTARDRNRSNQKHLSKLWRLDASDCPLAASSAIRSFRSRHGDLERVSGFSKRIDSRPIQPLRAFLFVDVTTATA